MRQFAYTVQYPVLFYLCLRVVTESLLLCGIDPPWDLSFGWTQIEAVIVLLFLFPGGPISNHTRIQMRGDQVCDAKLLAIYY